MAKLGIDIQKRARQELEEPFLLPIDWAQIDGIVEGFVKFMRSQPETNRVRDLIEMKDSGGEENFFVERLRLHHDWTGMSYWLGHVRRPQDWKCPSTEDELQLQLIFEIVHRIVEEQVQSRTSKEKFIADSHMHDSLKKPADTTSCYTARPFGICEGRTFRLLARQTDQDRQTIRERTNLNLRQRERIQSGRINFLKEWFIKPSIDNTVMFVFSTVASDKLRRTWDDTEEMRRQMVNRNPV